MIQYRGVEKVYCLCTCFNSTMPTFKCMIGVTLNLSRGLEWNHLTKWHWNKVLGNMLHATGTSFFKQPKICTRIDLTKVCLGAYQVWAWRGKGHYTFFFHKKVICFCLFSSEKKYPHHVTRGQRKKCILKLSHLQQYN